MTITVVMGTEPPNHSPWRSSDARRIGNSGPAAEDEPGSNRTDPDPSQPEDDRALARMLGCAMLLGIAIIVGLIVLIV